MSDQVHHALVEAKKLEQRVAAATTAASHGDANINATAGVQGNTLLREVTFKPGMMDAGLQTFRRSMLLHELATTSRLVVVLDDPDPSSRDAAFLSMWQLDGKREPAQPVHANGGDGYRKLRVALSGLAWQKHDRAHTAYAKRFYEGRVDAGFYSTKWFWLKASHDKQAWLCTRSFAAQMVAVHSVSPPEQSKPNALVFPAAQATHALLCTCSFAAQRTGWQVVSESEASSPAVRAMPGAHATQALLDTCSFVAHRIGEHINSK